MELVAGLSAAQVSLALLKCDHTCCACRIRGRSLDLWHVPTEKQKEILQGTGVVVMCQSCALDDLPGDELGTLRDDWLSNVAWRRIPAIKAWIDRTSVPLNTALTVAESLRASGQYELLAFLYHLYGNVELRDRYIDEALNGSSSSRAEIYLRSLQGRSNEACRDTVEELIALYKSRLLWKDVGSLKYLLGEYEGSISAYCAGLARFVEQADPYSTACVIREMHELGLHERFFERALRTAADNNDLWWEARCLVELDWRDELRDYISGKSSYVEQSHDLLLQSLFFSATGQLDKERVAQEKILSTLEWFN